MKNALFCSTFLAVALASGCDRKDENAAGSQPAPAAEAGDAIDGTRADTRRLAEPMFENYEPGFVYHLRSDKTATNSAGVETRRVVLEFIGADQQEIEQVITAELAKLGYRGRPPYERNGARNIQFVSKKDGPRVGVSFPAVMESAKLRAEGARGFVRFVWKTGK